MHWEDLAAKRVDVGDALAGVKPRNDPIPGRGGLPLATESIWTVAWGGLLRTARQVAGLSLADLSARTGLSKGYLSKLESGAESASNPSRATLAALARALPSFRPLAHTLAPGLGADGLAYDGVPDAQQAAPASERSAETSAALARAAGDNAPLHLGWRDLEVLAALVPLTNAALPHPLTVAVVARAVCREPAAVRPVLEQLVRCGIATEIPPTRPGGPPGFQVGSLAEQRLGVARLGDLLLLAAALLAASPTREPSPARHSSIAPR